MSRETAAAPGPNPQQQSAPHRHSAPKQQTRPDQKFVRCDNCGSEVAMDPEQRSYVCAFCDSTYVVEFSPDISSRQSPEFVIGFAVTPEQAK